MKIFVQSHRDGFRRCGVAHTREGREFPGDFFSDEQLKQLDEDPAIVMVAGVADAEPKVGQTQCDQLQDDGKGSVFVEPLSEALNMSDLAAAAGKAAEDGNTIYNGAPTVEAMETILGYGITADQRDAAWAAWNAGDK